MFFYMYTKKKKKEQEENIQEISAYSIFNFYICLFPSFCLYWILFSYSICVFFMIHFDFVYFYLFCIIYIKSKKYKKV